VESSGDAESLGEDASKQERRIDAIDADEDITLASVHDVDDKEMFDVDDLGGEELFVAGQNENVVKEVVDAAQAKIDADHQLAKRLQAQEQEELRENEQTTNTSSTEKDNVYLPKEHGRIQAQRFEVENFDYIQEMFDKAFKRVNTFKDFRTKLVEGNEKRVGKELIQEITKKQKVEDDKEKAKLKQLMESILNEKEVPIDAIPLDVKSPR
nr:hypothetical protein [Tanacetum cinerariifolium]